VEPVAASFALIGNYDDERHDVGLMDGVVRSVVFVLMFRVLIGVVS
jgi:hypothetical protein